MRRLKVGALFMGCGVGKTQTAVSLINSVEGIDCLVWICPVRTRENLLKEIEKCGLRYPVNIIGIESISQSDRIYAETIRIIENAKSSFLVCDESIKIKNMSAKRTRRALTLSRLSEYKIILNGTPLTRGLEDMYAQMEFLSPKILNMRYVEFLDKYCCYSAIKRGKQVIRRFITGYTNEEHLMSLISPYVYQCELNLPLTKHYYNRAWEVSEKELDEYIRLKERLLTIEEFTDNAFLGITQKMQHGYCCSQEKFTVLRKIVNDKTIVFCKFRKSAMCVKKFVKRLSRKALVLTYGKDSFGLNLQNYNRIVYFDKTFDYAFREQSEARIYRTGQQNDCEYFDITGDVGLESLIDSCISKKESLISRVKRHGRDIINELDVMKKVLYLGETDKVKVVKQYLKKNKNIKDVFVIGDELDLSETELPVQHVTYANTIMYEIAWYPWLAAINKNSLVIWNEALRSSKWQALNYSCIRRYMQGTDHRLIFNYWPIKNREEDFMIMWGLIQLNPYTKDAYKETRLDNSLIHIGKMEFEYTVTPVTLTEEDMREYKKEKEALIASVKRDPDIVPRRLLKWTEARSKKRVKGKYDTKKIFRRHMNVTLSQAPVDKHYMDLMIKFKESLNNVCEKIQSGR